MKQKTYPDTISLLWQRLKIAPTQAGLWLKLARLYAKRGLPWQAGYAARQAVRFDKSMTAKLKALKMGDGQAPATGDGLLGRQTLPEATALAEKFHAYLRAEPGDWLTCLYLARLQEMLGTAKLTPADAASVLPQAVALEPVSGESLHWMGVWRLQAGDAEGAVAALSKLLDIRPVRFGSMMYLGEALLHLGNRAAAETAFARASLSNNQDFLLTLSARVYAHNYWQEAIAILQKALSLRPDSVPILAAQAKIHWEVYELSKAQECCMRVLELSPNHQEAAYMLAALPGRMGDAQAHFKSVQEKYEKEGNPLSRLASSVAMTSLYNDALTPAQVAKLHRNLCAPIEAALTQKTDFTNSRSIHRRLRIGCVTGDLYRQHPVNIFLLPLLQHFDSQRFEVCVYYTGTMHDEYTRRAKACVSRWLEAGEMDDAALQAAIVADGIDILLDLAGHTSSHRLGVFAMRAARVQATFLGYPHSSGLRAMDWLIGDAVVSPAEHAELFSEGIAQLPHSVFCWAAVDDYPLPPPRPADAPLVLASFNNAMKLSPRTIALWAQVLRALPQALLLLKAPSFRDEAVQARFAALFAAQGIPRERLIFRGPSGLADMMQEYGEVDIALDPTPYNGGTTTLQALWMGVPVITLLGGNFVARMGASFMQSLGQLDWVAKDETGYVAAAVALVQDLPALRAKRALLRQQMAASPLCDIQSYVAHFEALLQQMWTVYCERSATRLIRRD